MEASNWGSMAMLVGALMKLRRRSRPTAPLWRPAALLGSRSQNFRTWWLLHVRSDDMMSLSGECPPGLHVLAFSLLPPPFKNQA